MFYDILPVFDNYNKVLPSFEIYIVAPFFLICPLQSRVNQTITCYKHALILLNKQLKWFLSI